VVGDNVGDNVREAVGEMVRVVVGPSVVGDTVGDAGQTDPRDVPDVPPAAHRHELLEVNRPHRSRDDVNILELHT